MKRFWNKLKYTFLKGIKPEIIGGWKNSNGVCQKHTGISNMSHISQQGDNLYIGDNVFIGHFNYIDGCNAKLTIGDAVEITNYVSILTHSTHNSIRFGLNEKAKSCGPVSIGNNTYIGPHSVIMPNTKTGKGCVISAYSYVKGEFPDYSILRGQPARVIGNTKETDEKLLKEYPELQDYYYERNEDN